MYADRSPLPRMSGLLRRLTRRGPATADESRPPTAGSSETAAAPADAPAEPGSGRPVPADEQQTGVLAPTGDQSVSAEGQPAAEPDSPGARWATGTTDEPAAKEATKELDADDGAGRCRGRGRDHRPADRVRAPAAAGARPAGRARPQGSSRSRRPGAPGAASCAGGCAIWTTYASCCCATSAGSPTRSTARQAARRRRATGSWRRRRRTESRRSTRRSARSRRSSARRTLTRCCASPGSAEPAPSAASCTPAMPASAPAAAYRSTRRRARSARPRSPPPRSRRPSPSPRASCGPADRGQRRGVKRRRRRRSPR